MFVFVQTKRMEVALLLDASLAEEEERTSAFVTTNGTSEDNKKMNKLEQSFP